MLENERFKSKNDRSKNDIFDDFICDLFSSKLSNSSMNMSLDNLHKTIAKPLPLDQTLLISTAKKEQIHQLLNNLGSSGSGLDIQEMRNGLRDLSSINHGSSSGVLRLGMLSNDVEPMKLDFQNLDDNHMMMIPEMDQELNMPSMMHDDSFNYHPLLKDLETSNLLSGVRTNHNIQKHLNPLRLKFLESLESKFEHSETGKLVISDIIKRSTKRDKACEIFMSLLVFQ